MQPARQVRGSAGAGETRTATCKFSLPFFLLGRVIPPVKAAAFKISLDATKMPSYLQLAARIAADVGWLFVDFEMLCGLLAQKDGCNFRRSIGTAQIRKRFEQQNQ